ncbi:MAG TPA: alpha/beta hydrolase [Pseudonocardiaceae bacterium]|nr:alpha/beta hydrolase [Pseudonocardiaceae bacterium]
MSRLDSLRHDLAGVRRFARRLKDEEHDDPVVPPLPPARLVSVPGRGEMFLRQQDGRPAGPTIVLLHGWALSADLNWFPGLYDTAASHGSVLALDLRGHGRGIRSDKPLTLELMADDVAHLVEHLGLGPVILVGYSMGGSVSLLVWKHHRKLVKGLVLISTALRWRTSLRERIVWNSMAAVEYGLRLGAPEGGMADRYLRMAVEQSPDLEKYKSWVKAEIRRGDPSDIAAAGRGLSAFDARDFARDIDVPTTVVVTARDRLIRAVRQRELAKAIPGARVVEMEGAHNAWLVRPKEFNDAVGDALSSVARRSPP